ncbi:MAG: ATP-binding protein, partial [Verrucomicrobiota bacterium]
MSTRRIFFSSFRRPDLLSLFCALTAALIGMTVLAGWHMGNVNIVRLQPNLVPMQYLTAFCFLLGGAGLASFILRLPRGISMACGAVIGGLGLIFSLEYLTGWKLGLDLLLPHFPTAGGLAPMRPARPTSAGFALYGAGIFILNLRISSTARRLAVWIFGTSAFCLGLMALFGYALGFTAVFVTGTFIGMAAHTAVGLTLLSTGLLATQWMTARRLIEDRCLPVPVAIGIIAGALMLWQTMAADRARALHGQAEVIARNVAADSLGRFKFSLRSLARMRMQWEQRGSIPYREWKAYARGSIQDQPILEAIARTDTDWKMDWVEPDANVSPLAGLDLHQEKRWKAAPALEGALRDRKSVVSPTLELDGGGRGFWIYLPMFPNGEFDGFLVGVFRLGNLKQSTLDEPAFSTSRIALLEGNELILGDLPLRPPEEGTTAEEQIEFRGHTWRFLVEPKMAGLAGARLPVVTLGMGSLLAAAVAVVVWSLQQSRQRNLKLKEEIDERQLAERQRREIEERLTQVLDSATGVCVITVDTAGVITYFSKGAELLLGYTAGEMVGRQSPVVFHDPAEVQGRALRLSQELGYSVEGFETFIAVPRRSGSERREWTYIRRDGSRRIVDLCITPLGHEDGGGGYLGTSVDITERKMLEREMREMLRAKKNAQDLLEAAGRIARLGHWELRLDGSGPRWSDITYGIHEVEPGTPVPLAAAFDFYEAGDRPLIQSRVEESMRTGEPFEAEARLNTARGRRIWVYIRGEPVRDENGAIIALHGILQDVDDRHRAAELLRQRNIELEAATARAEAHARAKAEFLANMSHEIRTPLNAVIGMSELLMDGQLDAREREFVETIHSSGDVLLSLINDILDFSKIESGQLDLERIPVPLRDCVESVMDLLAGQASRKNLDLMYWIDPAVPAAILGDPVRLRQVLVNLAGNALKFTAKGEVFVKLTAARGEDGAEWLHAAVIDTGIGIPESQTGRLFSAFSQVDASTTRRFGGTGLGLAISERLIRNMGGRIRVESKEGHGSTFRFEIPLIPAQIPRPAAGSGNANANGSGSGARGLEGRRLLIVDDNATN